MLATPTLRSTTNTVGESMRRPTNRVPKKTVAPKHKRTWLIFFHSLPSFLVRQHRKHCTTASYDCCHKRACPEQEPEVPLVTVCQCSLNPFVLDADDDMGNECHHSEPEQGVHREHSHFWCRCHGCNLLVVSGCVDYTFT